jgi:hypothetical protein
MSYDGERKINHGESISIAVTTELDNKRRAYLRFGLPSMEKEVASATLKLVLRFQNFTNAIYNINVYGLNDGDAGENWTEGTGETGVTGSTPPNPIVWNNAPQNNADGANGFLSGATLLGSFTVIADTVGTEYTFSSSSLVTFLNADTDGLVTFMMENAVTSLKSAAFATKENDEGYAAPKLEMQTYGLSIQNSGFELPETDSYISITPGKSLDHWSNSSSSIYNSTIGKASAFSSSIAYEGDQVVQLQCRAGGMGDLYQFLGYTDGLSAISISAHFVERNGWNYNPKYTFGLYEDAAGTTVLAEKTGDFAKFVNVNSWTADSVSVENVAAGTPVYVRFWISDRGTGEPSLCLFDGIELTSTRVHMGTMLIIE